MKKGNEFRVTGDDGEDVKGSGDAALHEPLLKNKAAAINSDLAAVSAGLSLGLSMSQCLKHFVGDGAFRSLAEQGFLK